jgi:multiple sugar transport system permease protein
LWARRAPDVSGGARILNTAWHRGRGAAVTVVLMVILLSLGFIFLYPVLYMISTSLKNAQDLVAPDVLWVPRSLDLLNFSIAAWGLRFWEALRSSIILSVLSAAAQTASCAVAGYGLARYRFPGRGLVFMLVVFTFIIPPQTLVIPLFIQFARYGWQGSYLPFVVPSLLAQGLRGSLFVIIFRQFFATLPWELEDSARIDGIGGLRIFSLIMLPLSRTAMLVVFLFSLVWHWNDHYLPAIFLDPSRSTLSVRLVSLWTEVRKTFLLKGKLYMGAQGSNPYLDAINSRNEGVGMAAALLVIVAPLLIYVFLQRYFTESIERTGLVE